jgi:hypothetical protein
LAETEGFEPSVPNYQYDGLANRWFQPLTHVSTWPERPFSGHRRLGELGYSDGFCAWQRGSVHENAGKSASFDSFRPGIDSCRRSFIAVSASHRIITIIFWLSGVGE